MSFIRFKQFVRKIVNNSFFIFQIASIFLYFFIKTKELDKEDIMKIEELDTAKIKNPPTSDCLQVTWLGHATYLVQFVIETEPTTRVINVLFDPVFSDRIGPVQLQRLGIGSARYRACPVKNASQLPRIDVVCISHDHYDHLDVPSITDLHRAFPYIKWCVAARTDEWLSKTLDTPDVVALSWWENKTLDLSCLSQDADDDTKFSLSVEFVPTQHWCLRGLTLGSFYRPKSDENYRLWGGWVLKTKSVSESGSSLERSVYHAGDTGYCDVFKTIGERHSGFDLSMIPIGAYSPRFVCFVFKFRVYTRERHLLCEILSHFMSPHQ